MTENAEAKQAAPPPPEAKCWIDQGLLRLEVPLFMPNGEYVAYGMLHKATQIVNIFFRQIEEAYRAAASTPKILTPVGVERPIGPERTP